MADLLLMCCRARSAARLHQAPKFRALAAANSGSAWQPEGHMLSYQCWLSIARSASHRAMYMCARRHSTPHQLVKQRND
jgi:hypothetical protein